jgi:hypothetical protein
MTLLCTLLPTGYENIGSILQTSSWKRMKAWWVLFFSVLVCAITASGVPRATFCFYESFSALCGWLAQRQGWRVKRRIWQSECATSARANSWLDYQRPVDKYEMGESGNENFVYSSLWDFKSYFTCRKILRHGTFPLYFPSDMNVSCGFLSPLKIHSLGRVLNPQTLDPVACTLTTTLPRRPVWWVKQVKY